MIDDPNQKSSEWFRSQFGVSKKESDLTAKAYWLWLGNYYLFLYDSEAMLSPAEAPTLIPSIPGHNFRKYEDTRLTRTIWIPNKSSLDKQ